MTKNQRKTMRLALFGVACQTLLIIAFMLVLNLQTSHGSDDRPYYCLTDQKSGVTHKFARGQENLHLITPDAEDPRPPDDCPQGADRPPPP